MHQSKMHQSKMHQAKMHQAKFRGAVLAGLSLLLVTVPLSAHHSFTMFDMSKQKTLTGNVTDFQWSNPHVYIEIDVPEEGGPVTHWSIEMGSPSILMQSGWKFSSIKKGDKITVVINPLKNGQLGGFLNKATLPDGRVLGNGPGREP
jgi:Family of unknown function (DUF6152)